MNTELLYDITLPESLISNNSTLNICYKNSSLGIILDAIEKLNRIPTGCFE